MNKILPVLIAAVCGFSVTSLGHVLPAIAHQDQMSTSGNVGAMIHVDPNDTPPAGQPRPAWFELTRADGSPIPLSDCNCQVMVHNAQDRAIIHDLPLASTSVAGEEVISTTITFPTPGSYTVVLSGESKDGSFEPFEIMFPITAVTP
jgi:hypothetical protein